MNKKQYADYLRSEHWKSLRSKKKGSVAAVRCAICGATDQIETHHLQYKNIFDVLTSDLRLLCRECHGVAHEIMRSGELVVTSKSHHGMFCQTKSAVKKKRGFGNRNMFLGR
jgi:hypothetical protein